MERRDQVVTGALIPALLLIKLSSVTASLIPVEVAPNNMPCFSSQKSYEMLQ